MKLPEYIYAMRITKLADDDYFVDYPFNSLNISGTAENLTDALALAKSSLEFTLFDLYESGDSFPIVSENDLMMIEQNKASNQYITLIATTLHAILEKFGDHPVKKMISIKQYQEFYLKTNHVSLSKYVQDKLEEDILNA